MALVVETGAGLPLAESYASVDFMKAYFKDRGVTIAEAGSVLEAKLRLATEYIDLKWGKSAIGHPISEDQALVYPTDYWITDPVSLPIALQRACAEYANYALTNDLYLNNAGESPGIRRTFEKVGPIETETEYAAGGLDSIGRNNPVVSKADSLMRSISNSGQGGVFR